VIIIFHLHTKLILSIYCDLHFTRMPHFSILSLVV